MTSATRAMRREGEDALAGVVRLLGRVGDLALDPDAIRRDPALPCLGLGADLAASQALALLPPDAPVDDPVPPQTDPVELLRAADALTRTLPIEAFPAGASQVIGAISDLLAEHTR